MKRAHWIPATFAAASIAACSISSEQAPNILTSGRGELRLPPSVAVVTIDVETRGPTAALATASNTPTVRRVQDALRAIGFSPDSNQTLTFSVEPAYDYQHGNRLVGYDAKTSLVIRFRALDKLATVLDGALAAGASRISEVTFLSDSAESGRRRALASAVTKARLDAAAIAEASGGRIGRLLKLSTGPDFSSESMRLDEMVVARGLSAPAIPEIRREVTVGVSIQATWEFLAGH